MRLLDLYCGAGGAAKGYRDSGLFTEIVGVDINPQKNYPYEFVQCDAIYYLARYGRDFDFIHASPPCQKFSALAHLHKNKEGYLEKHKDLIGITRQLLKVTNKPYVIENVTGSPLINPIMLCGTMFNLQTSYGAQLRRHRLFECSFPVNHTLKCNHSREQFAIGVYGGEQHPERQSKERSKGRTIGVYGNSGGSSARDGSAFYGMNDRREVMQIDWMSGRELNQAIPPAYTKYIMELYKELE